MPAAIAGFAIHYYFTRVTCSLGMLNPLCNLDTMAAPWQLALMLAGFAVTLFIAAAYGRSREEVFLSSRASPARRVYASGFTRLMCDMAEYQHARPLAWTIAALVGLGLVWEVYHHQLDGVTLALGLIALGVCLRCASYHPRRARLAAGADGDARDDGPEQIAHERSIGNEARFWSVARNTPPLSWIARTRRQPARQPAP
jgi:hypothetical protein